MQTYTRFGAPASLMRTSTVVDTGPAGGFALDGDDNVYVTRNSGTRRIRKIDPDGSLIETFAIDELEEPSGVAVNESTGVLYAAILWAPSEDAEPRPHSG